ncbi:hypothetical protein IID10_08805, partial [candidate division KSB1 bacterium]|nr:hypothetical protein [candidate division KSB1 bacterium]
MPYSNTSGISRTLIFLSLLIFAGGAFAQGSISDADSAAGATTNYTYNFTLGVAETFTATEVITITFPAGFNVANV